MNDYILKYESDNEWLSHHGILGQRKGVIRKNVGIYYVPKGSRSLGGAKEKYERDMRRAEAINDLGIRRAYKKQTAEQYKQERMLDRAERINDRMVRKEGAKKLSELDDEISSGRAELIKGLERLKSSAGENSTNRVFSEKELERAAQISDKMQWKDIQKNARAVDKMNRRNEREWRREEFLSNLDDIAAKKRQERTEGLDQFKGEMKERGSKLADSTKSKSKELGSKLADAAKEKISEKGSQVKNTVTGKEPRSKGPANDNNSSKDSGMSLKDINKLKGKKMSELSDKELDTLLERTKKEQMTSNFIKNTKKNESGDSTSVRDLSKSAQNLSSTLNDINRNAQRNKPFKKTKQIDLSDKSSAEIRSMIEHARLEQEYNSIVNTPQTRNGKAKVTAALAAVGTAAVVGTQVADFVITAKKLKE